MTAALIGPAPHILTRVQDFSRYGAVVRMNRALPLSPDMIRCTGPRCSILYLWQDVIDRTPLDVLRTVPLFRVHPHAKDISKLEGRGSFIPRALHDRMCDGKHRPNTGLLAMADLLDMGYEVYATGFTFFQTGYYPGYESHIGKAIIEADGDYGPHRQDHQIAYFREHIAPRIRMDEELRRFA